MGYKNYLSKSWNLNIPVYLLVIHSFFLGADGHVQPDSDDKPHSEQFGDEKDIAPHHYALHPQSAIKLAMIEQGIYTTFLGISLRRKRDMVPDEGACSQSLKKYLDDYEDDVPAIGEASGYLRGKIISENPLLLFRMIRRIVTILKAEVLELCWRKEENVEIAVVTKNSFYQMRLPVPEMTDLEEALNGLLRIQYVYGLNATSELRLGILQGLPTNATLNVGDCMDMFWYVMSKDLIILGYQWITAANLTFTENPTRGNTTEIQKMLSFGWKHFLRVAEFKSVEDAEKSLRGKKQDKPGNTNWLPYIAYQTCRGKSILTEDIKKDLKCYYAGEELHPYWAIQPVRLESLHPDPPVWMFHNFVGDKTIEYIKRKAFHESYKRSGVMTAEQYSDHRTSVQAWIYDDHLSWPDQEMITLAKRTELLLNLNVYKRGASQALQVVQYTSLGGHYDFHDDSLAEHGIPLPDGDRLVTFYIYLNDVELGGYTAFGKLGIFVKPEKGSAIVWRNVFLNGYPDFRAHHAGCPVIKGRKLGSNKWIMQHENMFKLKCTPNKED